MNEVSANTTTTKTSTGIKPRLSLLSSKQTSKPEDSPINDNSNLCFNNRIAVSEAAAPSILTGNDDETVDSSPATKEQNVVGLVPENELRPTKETICADENKMNVSKQDLIKLLAMLKSELQSKELALTSIKLEQLKRLINPIEISRSSLAKTYTELQDRISANEKRRNSNRSKEKIDEQQKQSASSESNQANLPCLSSSRSIDDDYLFDDDDIADGDQENLNLLSSLLELLDRHPLLALPRDSIYCLDYSCNELSTKNYLNLKIQHLDNLIDQHRRYRYYMGERLKRSEQRYMDLALKLELEKRHRIEREQSIHASSGGTILLNHITELKLALESEKASKQTIVMTLLNELLDEREKNEILTKKLSDIAKRTASNRLSLCKPRVPAKPAQLLDKQNSQSKNV